MTLRLSDLTPLQRRAMIKLDDGHPHEDSVGCRLDELKDELLLACYEMIPLGLVATSRGWDGAVWFRLTERGRMVRETGEE